MLVVFFVKIQSFESLEKEKMILPEENMTWVMNTDGVSNKHGARIGIELENSSRVLIEEVVRLDEKITNNEAEYEALLYGPRIGIEARGTTPQDHFGLRIGFGIVGRIIRSEGISHEVLP